MQFMRGRGSRGEVGVLVWSFRKTVIGSRVPYQQLQAGAKHQSLKVHVRS
jgi:hypothetical protein